MAIETPPLYTGIFEEEVIKDNDLQSFSEETYKKLGLNNNWLIDLRPIGSIIFVNINQSGGDVPSSLLFQQCDGTEIVNPNSPLRSIGAFQNFTPNLRDTYLRAASGISGNAQGGSQEHNLTHTHITGIPSSIGGGMQDKGDRRFRTTHNHLISEQYANPTVFDSPAYIYMIAYMKIV